jgi:hypothetical protein
MQICTDTPNNVYQIYFLMNFLILRFYDTSFAKQLIQMHYKLLFKQVI